MVNLVYPDPFGSFLRGFRQAQEDTRKEIQLLDRLYRTYLSAQKQRAAAQAKQAAAAVDTDALAEDLYNETFGEKKTLTGDTGPDANQNDTTVTEEDTGDATTLPAPPPLEEKLPLLPSTPEGELPQPVPPPPMDAPAAGSPKIQDRIPVGPEVPLPPKDQSRILPEAGPAPPLPRVPSSGGVSSRAPAGPASYMGKYPFSAQLARKIDLGGISLAERAAAAQALQETRPAIPYGEGRIAPPTVSDRAVGGSPADMYSSRPTLNRQTGQVANKLQGRIDPAMVQQRVAELYKTLYWLQTNGMTDTDQYRTTLAEYDRLNQILAR